MTKVELVAELKGCERRIAMLNDNYRAGRGLRPSEEDPAVCFRRNELRRMLIERQYEEP